MKLLKGLAAPFTALAGKVDHTVQERIRQSVIRHVVTALGAILITKGFLMPEASDTFIKDGCELVGLFLAGMGTASGVAQKQQ